MQLPVLVVESVGCFFHFATTVDVFTRLVMPKQSIKAYEKERLLLMWQQQS